MTIHELDMSVHCLSTNQKQEDMLAAFANILSAPYNKDAFSIMKTEEVIKNCLRRGHLSVFEHCNITIRAVVNIGVYKCITRHRHTAFTIESTNYCKYKEAYVITSFKLSDKDKEVLSELYDAYGEKDNSKFARDLLPQCNAATMYMTTNIRELRYIIGLRLDPNESPLVKLFALKLWKELNKYYPFFFPLSKNDEMALRAEWNEKENRPKIDYEEVKNELALLFS